MFPSESNADISVSSRGAKSEDNVVLTLLGILLFAKCLFSIGRWRRAAESQVFSYQF